jgi:alpha-glucosidase
MAAMMFTLRGTPIMYYGEEIGMENNDPQRVEDVKDPIGKIGWPKDKGRDGERTPMQWTAGEHAGFSKVDPWLPVAANYKTHNVAVEEKDPNSILSFYKALIHLRHANDALKNGSYVPVNENDPNMLSYLRKTDNGSVLVALNMSATPQQLKYDVSAQGIKQARAATLLATPPQTGKQVALDAITLPAFGVYIGELR